MKGFLADFIQGEITHYRFYMGLVSAMIFTIFGYLVSNYEKVNIYLVVGAIILLIALFVSFVALHLKIKKQIKSLEDL